MGYNI